MRFDLAATAPQTPRLNDQTIPLTITLKPAGRCPGAFEYKTDSQALLRMLRRETEVNGFELLAFRGDLNGRAKARLRSVALKDSTLRDIGFFID